MSIEIEKGVHHQAEQPVDPPKRFPQMIKWVGPSMAVAAAAVGSGEIINATRLGAIAGLAVLWVVFWGVFLKGFIQQEIGRYTLTTRKTITQGFSEIPGPMFKGKSWFFWIIAILLAIVILVIIAGIGGAIGGVLNILVPAIGATTWGTLAMLSIIPLLLMGTFTTKFNVYPIFERVMTLCVVGMTLVMIYIAFIALPLSDTYSYSFSDLMGGMTFDLPQGTTVVALAVLGTIGAGIELIFYSAWLTSKGYLQQAHHDGDSPRRREDRLRAWIHVLKLDNWLGVTITFVVTLAYFITGAVILHSLELVPDGVEVVGQVSTIFTEILGSGFIILFLIGAFAGLYSTALGVADGAGRMTTDIHNELAQKETTAKRKTNVYRWTVTIVVLAWIVFYRFISAPTFLITIGGAALSLLFPLYGLALLYLNRQVPKPHRMSNWTKAALWIGFILFTSMWFIEQIFG